MKTWIFQGNPERFDIDGYLAASTGSISWTVARYADEIAPGDSVYIWRSQGREPAAAGIVAEGTIAEHPAVQKDDPHSVPFWKEAAIEEESWRVRIRINRIASKREILKRDWMLDDSVLKDLLILRQAAGTNFPVNEAQARRLGQLWRKTGTDWGRDEVVAALWLYESVRDRPISKTAGSEVETLAQKLGRAPTGVYNKLMNLRAIDPSDTRKGFEGGSKMDEEVWNEFFDEKSARIDWQRLNGEFERLWGGGVISDKSANEIIKTEERRLSGMSVDDLLVEYARRPKNNSPSRRSQESVVYDRDPLVIALRKRLSNYQCEVPGCQSERFQTGSGEFFIEVHHLIPLSEGVADTLANTVSVCPTHHRLLHHGKDAKKLAGQLAEKRKAADAKLDVPQGR